MKQFFCDETGQLSMTRLMAFLCCVSALGMAWLHPTEWAGYLGILTLAYGGKVAQKKLSETKK